MEQLFTPLGIDHLVIVCERNTDWIIKFEQLGFRRVCGKNTSIDYDSFFGVALERNHVRIFLADPSTQRFSRIPVKQLLKHGGMQVVEVGIRYRQPAQSCTLDLLETKSHKLKAIFLKPQRAITPGQSIVFYKGTEVLGGGIIV